MSQIVRLQRVNGVKALTITRKLHPSVLIRGKWSNAYQRESVEGMVVVGQYFWVVRRGSPATDAFIMRHEDVPNKELYATNRMVYITEEGPGEDLFDLERPSLESYVASSVVPPEEGVDRFIDNEDKDTPLPILPSVSREITVTEADISIVRREGLVVYDDN